MTAFLRRQRRISVSPDDPSPRFNWRGCCFKKQKPGTGVDVHRRSGRLGTRGAPVPVQSRVPQPPSPVSAGAPGRPGSFRAYETLENDPGVRLATACAPTHLGSFLHQLQAHAGGHPPAGAAPEPPGRPRAPGWPQPAAGRWLSGRLINDPRETCPATLELMYLPQSTRTQLCSARKWCQQPVAFTHKKIKIYCHHRRD